MTRACVIIRDATTRFVLYRHCDGYPHHARASLNRLVSLLARVTANAGEATAWLLLIGRDEYLREGFTPSLEELEQDAARTAREAGAYTLTDCVHSDIDYLYEIDVCDASLRGWRRRWDADTRDAYDLPLPADELADERSADEKQGSSEI